MGLANVFGEQPREDSPPATLGEIVLAASEPAVPESQWVALVRAISAGDERALHALYERTHRVVFTLTMRIVRDRGIAGRLMLEVFEEVWGGASEYDPAYGSVVGWVMNLARSRAMDRLRQAVGSEVKR